jgi:hypothetical protein
MDYKIVEVYWIDGLDRRVTMCYCTPTTNENSRILTSR